MSTLGNIIWFILGGWWSFLIYAFLGLLFCITIIGIPIGKALFQYAKLMVFPFGKEIVKETDIKGKENVSAVRRVGGVIANIIWLPAGIVMFIGNICLAVVTAITIVGIPVAIVLVRSAKFLIWPVGARVITKEQAQSVRTARMMAANRMTPPVPQSVPQPVMPAPQNMIPQGAPAPQPAARRFCSQCGTECAAGAKFCAKCGAKTG